MGKQQIILNIRKVNAMGDQQQQVLLSEFNFPTKEIVILDEMVINSEKELKNIVEQGEKSNFELLIIPKIYGG